MNEDTSKMSFEQAFAKLEEIVSKLSAGKTNLEETISSYEQALKLKEFCQAKLDDAKIRIKILDEHNLEADFVENTEE